ncbi:MAG: lactate racemase domain-containing protein, partial [Intestinibacter sp.]
MATIHVPYSKTGMDLNIEDKNLLKVLTSKAHDFKPNKSESQLVEDSMDNPIGSKKLEELAVGKKNIVIITSDHTRPVPSKITMPIILRRIRSVNKDA